MADKFDARPAIAQALAALRRDRKMTRRQVANQLGRTETTVYRWEKGLSTPEMNDFYALADVYEVAPSAFFPSKATITLAQQALTKED